MQNNIKITQNSKLFKTNIYTYIFLTKNNSSVSNASINKNNMFFANIKLI